MVLISFAHIFLDFGFHRAIIQKAEVTQEQYSTVFFLNGGLALLLTLICYFGAGPLSKFYNQPIIQPVFRVLSISFLLNGLNLVPSALLYKRLQFKINSLLTLVASVISGIAGVLMAYNGYGVWSLVVQTLVSSFLILVSNFVYAKWFPDFSFRIGAIKPLWKYGSKMFASGVLDTLYTRLDTFIIGKLFSTQTLGFYARAQSMDLMVRQFSANSIMGALFPYITKHQHDRGYLKELYKKYLHIILFVSIGMSGILFLIAKLLFELLFTARWVYSAELFQLITIAGFAWPVSSLMCNIISGVGNSSAFFRLEVYKKIIVLPVYLFGFIFGLKGFIIFIVIMGFIGVCMNGLFVGKEIDMSLSIQVKIIFQYIILGTISTAICYLLSSRLPQHNNVTDMAASGFLFFMIYVPGAYLFKLQGVKVITQGLHKLKMSFQ